MDIELKIGDIIVDVATGDVGLLVARYSLFDDFNDDYDRSVWAWNMYWTGPDPNLANPSRYQPYTESGLLNLLRTGTFVLIKGL